MIITLTGSNAYLLKQKLDQLVRDFAKIHGELAIEKYDGEDLEKNQLFDAVGNLPFLAEKKMIVVRNLSGNKAVAETIEQIIDTDHEGIDLILYEPQIDERTSYYKVLKTKTEFIEYSDLEGYELVKWLVDEAKQQAAGISSQDAKYLVDRVGTNQVLLANELKKLATYDSEISRSNIDMLTEKNPQSKIFDLMDAAFSGNKQRALELYEEQHAQKIEPQEIIAMFAWQLRIIAAIKIGKGKNPNQIAKDLGMSPFPITKAQPLANKISDSEFTRLVSEIAEIDYLSKTRPVNQDDLLKAYILGI